MGRWGAGTMRAGRRGRPGVPLAAVLGCLALVASACGSTLHLARGSNGSLNLGQGGGQDQGLGATGISGPSGAGPNGSGALGGPAGSASGANGPGGSGSSGIGSGTSGAAGGASGPGVTATTISVGYPYDPNAAKEDAAIGATSANPGCAQCYFQAAVNDVNKHGGVAGRQLVVVNHAVDQSQQQDVSAQSMCTDFTQDHHVFAAFVAGFGQSLDACLNKAGVVQDFGDGFTVDGPSEFSQYPSLIEPSTLNLNRQASSIVDSASRQGYFSPGARVGIVTFDMPAFRNAASQAMIPALARYHVTPTDTAYVSFPQSTGDYSNFSAAINSAVLKFSSDRIDHVLILDKGGNAALFFMNRAQSQDYHPRYGLGGASGNTALVGLLGPNSGPQLAGATSNGWTPVLDLQASEYKPSPPAQQCLNVISASGQTYPSANAEAVAEDECSSVYSFKAGVEAGGPTINAGTFVAGINKLGTSFASPLNLGDNFSPSEHDGSSLVGDMTYVGSCSCFRYVGSPQQVPE